MKKILYITSAVPGKRGGGGESYSYDLIKELSKSCQIDLIYFYYANDTLFSEAWENVRVLYRQKINTVYKIRGQICKPWLFPIFTARYSRKVDKIIEKLVETNQYDVLYFDFSQTFVFATNVHHTNKILMAHDLMAQKYSRKKKNLLKWVMRSEKALLNGGTKIFTFSEKDCDIVKNNYCLESEHTTFFLNEMIQNIIPLEIQNYYVFFGSWGREENYNSLVWFVDEVLPLLDQSIKIKIIGGGRMPNRVMAKIKIPQIEFLGFMENPYSIIANAKAEIVPLRHGAGVKVKCVEALACGTPIIGTEVAFEGIPVNEGYSGNMILAKTAEEFAVAMNNISISQEERLKRKMAFCSSYDHKRIIQYILG